MIKKIKLFDPHIGSKELAEFTKVLKSHFWASGSGTGLVSKFEGKLRDYVGSKECIAVDSGTSALHLGLSLFNIKNKEVILPSLSFVSTAHAILYNGGKPKFVDVDPNTLCINPDEIQKKISKKTKVILPVHFGGIPCDLQKIQKICDEYNVNLVEDAAHAIGSTYKGKKIGTHGDAVCFSFHAIKNLAMPKGGALAINGKKSIKFHKSLLSKRWCGISKRKGSSYDISELGWNYYLDEFSASMGIIQLKKLDKMNSIRKKIAKRYHNDLTLGKKMPFNKESSYHLYWIRVRNRKKFILKMKEKGIETGIHYNPIHKMSFYKEKLKLPITENACKELVSLPMHPNLSENDVDYIIKSVNELN